MTTSTIRLDTLRQALAAAPGLAGYLRPADDDAPRRIAMAKAGKRTGSQA